MIEVWKHDDLQADLAQTRAEAGDIAVQKLGLGAWGGHAQADVVTIRPSWSNPTPTIYEVKVTRSDFLRDVRAEKFEKYLPYCRRLYFAVPKGLVVQKEVPERCGLCWRGPKGWHTVRAPWLSPVSDGNFRTLLFAVLLAHHPAPWKETREGRVERLLGALRGRSLGDVWLDGLKLSREVRRLLEDGQKAEREVLRLTQILRDLDS